MAETAYDLHRFAPRESKPDKQERKPKVRVAKSHSNTAKQVFKMVRTLLTVGLLVVLVCGVLYTQTTITELQSQVSQKEQDLVEQEALHAYLNFELESMTTPRAIEQRAAELGLVPMNSNQISYIQVEEGDQIQVRESTWAGVTHQMSTGVQAVADQLNPK